MSEYNIGNKLQNITLNRGLEVYSNETVLEPEDRNLSEDLEQILDEELDLDDDKVLDKVSDKVLDDDKNTKTQIQILEPESNNDIFKYLFIFSLVVIGILIYNRNVK